MKITRQNEPASRARKLATLIAAFYILQTLTSPAIAWPEALDKQIKFLNDGIRALKNNSPKDALKLFHQTILLAPNNPLTRRNLDETIVQLGKSPGKFDDRVELGDAAASAQDLNGAIAEYEAAVELHEDPKIHVKLGDVYRLISEQQHDLQLRSYYRKQALEQYAGGLYGQELKQKLRLLEAGDSALPETTTTAPNKPEAFKFNKQQFALVAVPALVTIFVFAGRRKRTSIWMIGLFIAGIFALTGFLSFS